MSKNKIKWIKSVLTLIFLSALLGVGIYSYQEYNKSQLETEGIVVCSEDECVKTMHMHSDISFNLCGENPMLPREVGELSGLHTHKEKNSIHFHDKVQLESDQMEQQFDERLSLQEVIDVFELSPMEYCGTDEVIIEVFVNGEHPYKGLDYNWEDGDLIEINYRRL